MSYALFSSVLHSSQRGLCGNGDLQRTPWFQVNFSRVNGSSVLHTWLPLPQA